MSYRNQPEKTVSALLGILAWGLVGAGVALLVFVVWHQITLTSTDRKYGIEEPWWRFVLFTLALAALDAVAAYSAAKRHYGVSIAFGGFVFAIVGLLSLMVLAQVGL